MRLDSDTTDIGMLSVYTLIGKGISRYAPIVYWLVSEAFNLKERVQFPLGVRFTTWDALQHK